MRVQLGADEMYPVLTVSEYGADGPGAVDAPDELLQAITASWTALDEAEGRLLRWLHEREPDHPIFRRFPVDDDLAGEGRQDGS